MKLINLFVVGFGRPDLLREQRRLLNKYLADKFSLTVVDNTPDANGREGMARAAFDMGVQYVEVKSEKHEHPDALRVVATLARGSSYWGAIDHDLFPRAKTELIEKIDKAGFYGIGQRHGPTQARYLFPGFCFFSEEWLRGRVPNFDGIRGIDKRDDGDCGSMMNGLFTEEDWARMYRGEHGYGFLRDEDGHGLQSFGYEYFDRDWIHFTNGSNWKQVPDPEERTRLIMEKLASL